MQAATRVDSISTAKTIADDTAGQNPEETSFGYQAELFAGIRDYPIIKDSAAFIKELIKNCQIGARPHAIRYSTINYFKRISVFGSAKNIYIIEWDFHGGPMTEYPWKEQLIFNANGKLLKLLNEARLDTETIFPGKNPFLFGLSSTAKGNGRHEVFRIRKDNIEQVYDGFLGNRPQTYSTGYSNYLTEPNELYHKFSPVNDDGFNDIIFYGKVKYELGNQNKTILVRYNFIYNSKKGHFTEEEDYSKKYEFIYGDTK